jgi:MFS family permease
MTAVYTLNLVDRGLINLFLEPIKRDLRLSDTQLGFLTGMAFALFYAVAGLPIARWADRGNRASIASMAIGVWGLTVMVCLFVTSYAQLVFARIAAAVGEAGCKPPTYSLIGDYFPDAAERTRAMSIYWLGNPIATLIGFGVGGWLNEIYGWRTTFFLMGIPGLLLAIIVKLTIADPRGRTRTSQSNPTSTMSVLARLWRQRSSRHLCLALILLYTMGSGLNPWYAAFMMRSFGMGTAELGLWLGIVFCVGGIAGTLLGGSLSARFFASNERSQLRMSAVAVALFLPCLVAFVTLPRQSQALLALLPLIAAFSFFMGPTYALLQRLVPDDTRATVLAIVLLLVNLIGMGLGPQVVGFLSDELAPSFGADALRIAMLAVSAIALWSSYHFWRAGEAIREDLLSVRA